MNHGMLINPQSEVGITNLLITTNGDLPTSALAHLFTDYQEVSWHATLAELELERLEIPKRMRPGASRVITSAWAKLDFGRIGIAFPSVDQSQSAGQGAGHGAGQPHQATRITIVRTAGGWRLVKAEKLTAPAGTKVKMAMHAEPIQLTRAQAAEAIERHRATFAVQAPIVDQEVLCNMVAQN